MRSAVPPTQDRILPLVKERTVRFQAPFPAVFMTYEFKPSPTLYALRFPLISKSCRKVTTAQDIVLYTETEKHRNINYLTA